MSKGKFLDRRLVALPSSPRLIPDQIAIGPFHRIAGHAEVARISVVRKAAHFLPESGEIGADGVRQGDAGIRRPSSGRARRPRLVGALFSIDRYLRACLLTQNRRGE